MPFEYPPKQPTPAEDTDDSADDGKDPFSHPWFAPEKPREPETVLEQLRSLVETNRRAATALTTKRRRKPSLKRI